DFADTPNKLRQVVHAVKEQYPAMQLITVFQLHAQESLDETYLRQYEGVMDEADIPVVFANLEVFKQKNYIPVSENRMREFFRNNQLIYLTGTEGLLQFLKETDDRGKNLLFAGEGNWGG